MDAKPPPARAATADDVDDAGGSEDGGVSTKSMVSKKHMFRRNAFEWSHPDDDHDGDHSNAAVTYSFARSRNDVRALPETTICCLSKTKSPMRRLSIRIVTSKYFQGFVALTIIVNAVFLAIVDPVALRYGVESTRNLVAALSEPFFMSVYTMEMILQMIAWGIYLEGKQAYFKSYWSCFDFVVVVFGWTALGVFFVDGPSKVPSFLKAVRVLRPIRLMQHVPGLEPLFATISRSSEQLLNVWTFLLMVFIIFTLIGVELYHGVFHQRCGWYQASTSTWRLYGPTADRYCDLTNSHARAFQCPIVNETDPITNQPTPVICVSEFPAPGAGLLGFDNFFQALLTVFVMSTLEGWSDVMYALQDATGPGAQVFCMCIVLFGAIVGLNLVIAVLTINYSALQSSRRAAQTESKQELISLTKSAKERKEHLNRISKKNMLMDVKMRLMWSWEHHNPDDKSYTTMDKLTYLKMKQDVKPRQYAAFKQRMILAFLGEGLEG